MLARARRLGRGVRRAAKETRSSVRGTGRRLGSIGRGTIVSEALDVSALSPR